MLQLKSDENLQSIV